MGIYDKDPIWDDVVPIAQDDGEGALAQIAYTDEYAEGEIVAPFSFLYHANAIQPWDIFAP